MPHTSYTTPLRQVYGPQQAEMAAARVRELVDRHRNRIPPAGGSALSERDALLITYPDQVREAGIPPLRSLAEFCETHLKGLVSGVHLLPFYPWSSDDGFSVKDHRLVDPALGDWAEIERLGRSFRLMFDAVINHASVQGTWFEAFLRDEAPYREYFLTVEGAPDLSRVVRPRALPLLTEFQTTAGTRWVWTTFSADQADLDYHQPRVLLEMLDILLQYVGHGARFLRLDAVAYLWKEPGTTCIHLPQTHAILRLVRLMLDDVAPHVRLVTETNVPHAENISYFGNGNDEAHLVYNFALPPLVLHTLHRGSAAALSQWAAGLKTPSAQTTFFNFLASHDGIGLDPVRGILSAGEIEDMVGRARLHGGLISEKQNPDGSRSPYELNISFFDALSDPGAAEPLAMQVGRFMASQAIMLCLQGLPGIYFHSLFGSRNWLEGVRVSGQNRTINRQKLDRDRLERELADPGTLRGMVFRQYRQLLARRSTCAAFHPQGEQEVLDLGKEVFAVLRTSPDRSQRVLCLQNVTAREQQVRHAGQTHVLDPYQALWKQVPARADIREASPFYGDKSASGVPGK